MTRLKTAFAAGSLAAASLVLSGCMTIDTTLNIDSEATISGELTASINKAVAQNAGVNNADQFAAMFIHQAQSDTFTCDASETDTTFDLACVAADGAFTDDMPWSATLLNEEITFIFTYAGDTTASTSSDLPNFDAGALKITVNFPGPITSVTGEHATKNSDTTLVIDSNLVDPLHVTAVSDIDAPLIPGIPNLPTGVGIGLAIVAGLAVAGGLGWLLYPKNRPQATTGNERVVVEPAEVADSAGEYVPGPLAARAPDLAAEPDTQP